MSYLYGLGDPTPLCTWDPQPFKKPENPYETVIKDTPEPRKWGRITQPQLNGIWGPMHEIAIRQLLDADLRNPLLLVGTPRPMSNLDILDILAETYPNQSSQITFDSAYSATAFGHFVGALLVRFEERLVPVPEEFTIPSNLKYHLGREFFKILQEIVRLPALHIIFNASGIVLTGVQVAAALTDAKFVKDILATKGPYFIGSITREALARFQPIYTEHAETKTSAITFSSREGSIRLAVEPRIVATNEIDPTIDLNAITWTIAPRDRFILAREVTGPAITLPLDTSVHVYARVGDIASAYKTVDVTSYCVRCRQTYNVGGSGDYDCHWELNAQILHPRHGHNKAIGLRGRHHPSSRMPDGLGDIRVPGNETTGAGYPIWRDTPTTFEEGDERSVLGDIRAEYHNVLYLGISKNLSYKIEYPDFNAKYGDDQDRYRDYLMTLEKLYHKILHLKPL